MPVLPILALAALGVGLFLAADAALADDKGDSDGDSGGGDGGGTRGPTADDLKNGGIVNLDDITDASAGIPPLTRDSRDLMTSIPDAIKSTMSPADLITLGIDVASCDAPRIAQWVDLWTQKGLAVSGGQDVISWLGQINAFRTACAQAEVSERPVAPSEFDLDWEKALDAFEETLRTAGRTA